jgi:hypothetical protein
MYLYQHDATGRIIEVLALDETAQHVIYDNAGRTLAAWCGPHLVSRMREVAYTRPHCVPAGTGWRRDGEALWPDGLTVWRWERLWTPVQLPERPDEPGKGKKNERR